MSRAEMGIDPIISSALGGALHRRLLGGWEWSDGSPEPRARDMTLQSIAPNFRCVRHGEATVVEIPTDWGRPRYWPHQRVDADARAAIATLIREAGTPAPIYAEGWAEVADDHRLTRSGICVPIAAWDDAMCAVVGAWWDKEHEADILSRAEALR